MVIDLLPDERQYAIWDDEAEACGDAVRLWRTGNREPVIPEPHFDRASVEQGAAWHTAN